MGGHGDPYMVPPESAMCGEIRREGEALIITIPNAKTKTPQQIGKIAEDLAKNLSAQEKAP